MRTTLCVNNTIHKLLVDSRLTLLDALRDVLGLTGTKKGCMKLAMDEVSCEQQGAEVHMSKRLARSSRAGVRSDSRGF